MIAYLKGRILNSGENFVVIENSGVGYKVFTVPAIAGQEIGAELELHTYMQVREDIQALFGFATAEELEFFELLITVSGVGPKMALAVLSAGDLQMLRDAIAAEDAAVFNKIGGVGRKTAEKIILELKDKISGMRGAKSAKISSGSSDDLLAALEALGYSNKEIREILPKLEPGQTEQRLRQALKLLSR